MSKREPAIDGDALAGLLLATRESLQAFQATQAKTAEVHAEFLRSHAKASECFTALFATHARLVELATGGSASGGRSAVFPAASQSPAVAPVHLAPIMSSTASSSTRSPDVLDLPDNAAPHVRASDELPPELSASALTAMIKGGVELPNPTSHAAAVAVQPAVDVLQMVIDTVAEKTGYPNDLLSGGMDLETDLGVDSIKRVEIVGALQDASPSGVELDADQLATLRTLDDIAGHLRGLLGAGSSVVAASLSTEAPVGSVEASISVDSSEPIDVAAVLIETVAERTGYPADLLALDMDLETDLGVDSIKRVEIVSALQEALPSLPEIDSDEMATLRTLGEIADYVERSLPNRGDRPSLEASSAPVAPPIPGRVARSPGTALNVKGIVLDTIASRTGFPAELLGIAMDLEGDLGIDSIKRVEIMSALAEAMPEVGELDDDEISGLRTIGEIIEHLQGRAGPRDRAVHDLDEEVPVPPTVGLLRREVVIGPATAGEAIALGGACVVTRDHLGVAERLAAELRSVGVDAGVIDPDWSSDADIRSHMSDNTRSVVHAAALGASGADLRARVRGGFLLARAATDARLFATLTGMGGTFGLDAMIGDPLQGALCGLAKTVAQERPGRRALALDIDPDQIDMQVLADELMTDRGVVEVGLGERVVGVYDARIDIDPRTIADVPLQAGELVVVTGGARGVTAAVVMEMARRWQPTFLLLGRSHVPAHDPSWADGVPDDKLKPARIGVLREEGAPFDPKALESDVSQVTRAREVRRTLDAIRATGCLVAYSVADVRDQDAIFSAIHEAERVNGPVRGVVHGAGVIADKLLDEKSERQFDLVFETKVLGLQHVLAACSVDQLKLFAAFSSVAGRYGNRGQVDYSMANEAITHVAKALSNGGVAHVKAFHWGPWRGGMVSASLAAAFSARGLVMIDLQEGAEAFCDEFERGGPAVEVVIGGPPAGGALIGGVAADTERALEGSVPLRLDSASIYLDDHRIDGRPVLPFAMALEFMVSQACRACPGLVFREIRDVAVLKGVVLEEPSVEMTLRWRDAEPHGSEVALAFELLGQPNALGLPTVHYRGTVELGSWGPTARRHVVDEALHAHGYPLSVEEAYRTHLFHGPGFQGIQRVVGMSERGLVATVLTSVPAELGVDAERWCTDPVALDSALQLVGLWVQQHRTGSALPVFIESYRQVAPLHGELLVAIEMAPTKTSRGSFDVAFVDAGGRTIASLRGGQYTAMPGVGYRRGEE